MFTRHKFLLLTVKEWLKSVLNHQSYPKKVSIRFWTTLYYITLDRKTGVDNVSYTLYGGHGVYKLVLYNTIAI